MHVNVHGETAHAGPTPMDRRRNALIGAAMLAVAVNDIGWKYGPRATRRRRGSARGPTRPGFSPSTPRSHATSVTPIRPSPTRCGPKSRRPWSVRPADSGGGRDTRRRDILSSASHDAYYIPRIAPTAMIFTPCRDGSARVFCRRRVDLPLTQRTAPSTPARLTQPLLDRPSCMASLLLRNRSGGHGITLQGPGGT